MIKLQINSEENPKETTKTHKGFLLILLLLGGGCIYFFHKHFEMWVGKEILEIGILFAGCVFFLVFVVCVVLEVFIDYKFSTLTIDTGTTKTHKGFILVIFLVLIPFLFLGGIYFFHKYFEMWVGKEILEIGILFAGCVFLAACFVLEVFIDYKFSILTVDTMKEIWRIFSGWKEKCKSFSFQDWKEKKIDNKLFRFGCLFIAAILGCVVGVFSGVDFFCKLGLNREVAKYLATVVIGIPVLALLWYFRTRDVRQQICQNHYNNAVENLTGNTRARVEVGTHLLITLHKLAPDFKESIEIAFKERLKFYAFGQQEIKDIKITYGRHILKWLMNNKTNEIIDLRGADLSDQDLLDVNFKYYDLSGAKFKKSNLKNTKFENCIITDVDFKEADLKNAHFDNCNKKGANFDGAYGLDDETFKNCYEK